MKLYEVRYIKTPNYKHDNFDTENEPLKRNEVIRVYHGFHNMEDALVFCKYGMSGKSWSGKHKVYSYEVGNNPYGLFVSTDFRIVKNRFSYGGVIIEFSARVSDLEAPVWNSPDNSYFVQGQQTSTFRNKEERDNARIKARKVALNNNDDYIQQSDIPELTNSLVNDPENQAIYTGDLNPNMIKRVWVHENKMLNNNTFGDFVPMSRREFLNKYDKEISNYTLDKFNSPDIKFFKPNENFSLRKIKDEHERKYFIEMFNRIKTTGTLENTDLYVLKDFLYPKQIIQVLGIDIFRKYFNNFY